MDTVLSKSEQKTEKVQGNYNLISNDEEMLVAYLKERNLSKVNESSEEVYPSDTFYVRYVKRILDLAIAVPAFTVFLPFNIIFGVCTYFDVGRPIFYRQTRVGRNGKPFILIKFRNMNNKTDKDGKLLPAKDRVTKFGKFMRKLSLDELLNFWSVIKGDMSIIGPRPLPEFFLDRMSERHKKRHCVKPGLECPCIIPENTQISAYHWKFENEVWYVENVGLLTDIKMLINLFKLTLNMKKRGGNAGGFSHFVGYDDSGYATTFNRMKRLNPTLLDEIKKDR